MAGQTVTTAVFRAEEEGVAAMTGLLGKLQGGATGAAKAVDDFSRTTDTSAKRIATIERGVDALQKRLAGAPAAWKAYERDLAVATRGMEAGKLSAEAFARTVQQLQADLQRVVAPRLAMDIDSSGLSGLLGTTEKVTVAQREAATAALQNAAAQKAAAAETARSQALMAEQVAKLRADLNPAAAAQAALTDELSRYNAMAAAGAIEQDELAAATALANQRFGDTTKHLRTANDNVKLTSGQVQNLGYQVNDVATMLAMGASPFQIIASQAGQVIQALQDGPGGVTGSLKAIGSAVGGVLSAIGPMRLAIGAATAAAGAFWLMSGEDNAKKAEDALKSYDAALKSLKGSFGETASAAEAFFKGASADSLSISLAKAQGSAIQLKAALAASIDAIGRMEGVDVAAGTVGLVKDIGGSLLGTQYSRDQATLRGLYSELAQGKVTADQFADSVAAIRLDPNTSEAGKKLADSLLEAADAARLTEARLGALGTVLDQAAVKSTAMGEAFRKAMGDLRALGPETGTPADEIAAAFERAAASAQTYGQIVGAANAANAASAELARPSVEALTEAQNALANAKLPPTQRSIAEIRQRADAEIEALQKVTGSEEAAAARRQQMDAEIALVTNEATQAEAVRRAGHLLDLKAIGDRTAAQKAATAGQRAYAEAIGQGLGETAAATRRDEAATLSLAQANDALSVASRQRTEAGQAQVEQAQFELTLVGKSAAETARLTAEYQMLTAAKQSAAQAGSLVSSAEEASIRSQAAAIGEATAALEKLNFERDVQFRLQQATRSPEEQRIAEEVRSYGEDITTASGQAMAAQLRYVGSVEKTADELQNMRDIGKDAFLDIIDALGSGEDAVDGLMSAFASLGKQMASLGAEKLFKGLFGDGSGQSSGAGGILGALTGGAQRGAANQNTPPPYTAPVGRVDRAPLPPLVTGEGFSSGRAASVAAQSVPARVWNFFASKGLADHQIAGIMGNAKAESAFNPTAVGDEGQAFGLFQWNDRKNNLFNHIGGRGNLGDVDAQLDFAWKELQTSESRAYRALLQANDVTEATEAYLGFERPHGYNTGVRNSHNYSGRVGYAQEAYEQFGGRNVASSTNDSSLIKRGVSDGMVDADRRLGPSDGYAGGRSGDEAASKLFNPKVAAGLEVLGAGVGSFANGYQSGSPFSGGLSGAFSGYQAGGAISSLTGASPLMGSVLGVVGGAALGIFGGILGARAERERKHREAEAKWNEVRPEYEAFDRSLSGEGTGQLREMIGGLWSKLSGFMEVGGAAWKYGSGNSSAQFDSTGTKMFKQWQEAKDDFLVAFPEMLEDLTSGEGLEGAFVKGRAQVRNLRESIRNFVDDVKVAFMDADIGIPTSGAYVQQSKEWEARRAEAEAQAKRAAGEYALTLLYLADETSEVEKAIDSFKGSAVGLIPVLVELGWTTEQAMTDIHGVLQQALADLRGGFETGISDRVLDLQGKGYMLEVRDFLKEFEGLQKDAALLGADTSQFGTLFKLQMQSIVDGAELVGPAFNELIAAFPQLAGVVTQYTQKIDLAARRAEAVSKAESDLSAAMSKHTEQVNERIAALRTEASELDTTIDRLTDFVRSIGDLRNELKVDDNLSPLSAQDRFFEAQQQFRTLAAKAQGGDEEAQAALAGASREYLEESRNFWASSEKYHESFDEVQEVLKRTQAAAQSELSAAEKQLKAVEASIKVEEQQLEALQKQVDALLGINANVMSVAAAIKALAAAQRAASGIPTEAGLPGGKPIGQDSRAYQYLANNPDVLSAIGKGQRFGVDSADLEVIAKAHWDQFGQYEVGKNGRVAYATGGLVRGPGTATSDSIPAWLSNGEHVTRAASVTAETRPFLAYVNRMGRVPDPYPQAMPARGANDNGNADLLAEIRQMNAKLDAVTRVLTAGLTANVEATKEGTEVTRQGDRRAGLVPIKKAG